MSNYTSSIVILTCLFCTPLSSTFGQPANVGEADETAEAFTMTVADRFRISDGGLVLTGTIAAGSISVGDSLCLVPASGSPRGIKVTGIESFNKLLDSASAGEQVGLLVTGVARDDVNVGDLLQAGCG